MTNNSEKSADEIARDLFFNWRDNNPDLSQLLSGMNLIRLIAEAIQAEREAGQRVVTDVRFPNNDRIKRAAYDKYRTEEKFERSCLRDGFIAGCFWLRDTLQNKTSGLNK